MSGKLFGKMIGFGGFCRKGQSRVRPINTDGMFSATFKRGNREAPAVTNGRAVPHLLRPQLRSVDGDLDVAASYPNGECVFNVSKETTARELVSIEGVSEQTRRMQGINLCAGHVNAVEVCVGLFKLPTLDMLLDSFVADNNLSIEGVNVEDAQYINAFIASDEALAKASLAEYDEDES